MQSEDQEVTFVIPTETDVFKHKISLAQALLIPIFAIFHSSPLNFSDKREFVKTGRFKIGKVFKPSTWKILFKKILTSQPLEQSDFTDFYGFLDLLSLLNFLGFENHDEFFSILSYNYTTQTDIWENYTLSEFEEEKYFSLHDEKNQDLLNTLAHKMSIMTWSEEADEFLFNHVIKHNSENKKITIKITGARCDLYHWKYNSKTDKWFSIEFIGEKKLASAGSVIRVPIKSFSDVLDMFGEYGYSYQQVYEPIIEKLVELPEETVNTIATEYCLQWFDDKSSNHWSVQWSGFCETWPEFAQTIWDGIIDKKVFVNQFNTPVKRVAGISNSKTIAEIMEYIRRLEKLSETKKAHKSCKIAKKQNRPRFALSIMEQNAKSILLANLSLKK